MVSAGISRHLSPAAWGSILNSQGGPLRSQVTSRFGVKRALGIFWGWKQKMHGRSTSNHNEYSLSLWQMPNPAHSRSPNLSGPADVLRCSFWASGWMNAPRDYDSCGHLMGIPVSFQASSGIRGRREELPIEDAEKHIRWMLGAWGHSEASQGPWPAHPRTFPLR